MTGMPPVIQVIGAMVIFSLVLMKRNRFMLMNDLDLIQNEYEQVAMAAGQSIINEAKVKAFDEEPNDDVPNDFTSAYGLGQGAYETRRDPSNDPYDDFDDYNGYTETRTINGVDYDLSVDVCYVEASDLDQCLNYRTTYKLMTVDVNNQYMNNEVTSQMIKSFY